MQRICNLSDALRIRALFAASSHPPRPMSPSRLINDSGHHDAQPDDKVPGIKRSEVKLIEGPRLSGALRNSRGVDLVVCCAFVFVRCLVCSVRCPLPVFCLGGRFVLKDAAFGTPFNATLSCGGSSSES